MLIRNVKNTMQNALANIISPHYCCSCGEIGAILCAYCKYDIVSNPYELCVSCTAPTSGRDALCERCIMPYSRAWCISERQGSIEMLLKRYKFERAKSAYVVIAELLHETLPVLPPETIIVSVPTVQSHIRRRGYDHASLIAKELARRRILPYKPLLLRAHNSVQLGATKKVRHQQASVAYTAQKNNEAVILLVDDVFTTGATAYFSAKALRDAGAQDVFLAVVARQALEKSVEY